MKNLLISFFGDDFTGSTDAMETLALAGLQTVLFTAAPSRETLARYPDLEAFGIAGTTRAMNASDIERTLRPTFESLRASGAPIVHYKVCSTFDSSPEIGSIGRVIDVGIDVFGTPCVPLVVAAPSLGRYCVFGNLYARLGAGGEVFRLDRHPSISRHPITPMHEADLRLHLSKQTRKSIGLLDILQLECTLNFETLLNHDVLLIDALHAGQMAKIGALIDERSRLESPLFVVGSSGVESALADHWKRRPRRFDPAGGAGPMVAVCGSCSPVTAEQIRWASANGFDVVTIENSPVRSTQESIRSGRSVVIHTNAENRLTGSAAHDLGRTLGDLLREILSASSVRRVLIAGGDTSGQIASVLGIESMEMIGTLTRGSPLCRVTAPNSPADGIEMTFKGGQIGPVDFFGMAQKGISHG